VACKFTAGFTCNYLAKLGLHARKLIASNPQCLGTVPLKDEELARYLEYSKKQLLLTVVTLILTWVR